MTKRNENLSNCEKLYAAIGEIDDSLIREASTPYRQSYGLRKFGTIAASVALILTVVITAYRILPAFAPAGDAAPGKDFTESMGNSTSTNNENTEDGTDVNGDAATLYYGNSTLTITDRAEGSVSFTVVIKEALPSFIISITGNGYVDGEYKSIIATTADDTEAGYTKIGAPKITVNGAAASQLPTEAGTYSITVDVSLLRAQGYELSNRFTVSPFGNIFI